MYDVRFFLCNPGPERFLLSSTEFARPRRLDIITNRFVHCDAQDSFCIFVVFFLFKVPHSRQTYNDRQLTIGSLGPLKYKSNKIKTDATAPLSAGLHFSSFLIIHKNIITITLLSIDTMLFFPAI